MMTSKQQWFINKLMTEIETIGGKKALNKAINDTNYGSENMDSYKVSVAQASEDIQILLTMKEELTTAPEVEVIETAKIVAPVAPVQPVQLTKITMKKIKEELKGIIINGEVKKTWVSKSGAVRIWENDSWKDFISVKALKASNYGMIFDKI